MSPSRTSLALACLSLATPLFAAPVPPLKPDDREVHIVCVHEGWNEKPRGFREHADGIATIRLDRPGKVVTLVLAAYRPVVWEVTITPQTQLPRVILGGYYRQSVRGIPENGEVVDAYHEGRPGLTELRSVHDMARAEFRPMIQQVHALTGMQVASFQGTYRFNPALPFVVNRVQAEPRLRTDYPQPVPPADLPRLSFEALHFVPGQLRGLTPASHGLFTLTGGPDANTLRPLPPRLTRLTVDPTTDRAYGVLGHDVYEINRATNGLTKLDPGPDVPELSWPCGVAFDTKRNRLVVASLGGVGYLYAFAPATGQWSVVADLNNVDLAALAYHAKDDALYGLAMTRDGNTGGDVPLLHRWNEKGATVSLTSLTGPVIPGLIARQSDPPAQLVSVGDQLVLLATTSTNGARPAVRAESFIYLIDPKTGTARLTWKQ